MTYAAAYIGALVVFGIIDAIWLSWAVPAVYKPMFGDQLADPIRMVPAAVFYFSFPVGVVVFAIAPALKENSALLALGLGALFGLVAYGTYDLTNHATLKFFTAQAAMMDIAYGTVTIALSALGGYFAARLVA
jgi:uncharacterized membrane protein